MMALDAGWDGMPIFDSLRSSLNEISGYRPKIMDAGEMEETVRKVSFHCGDDQSCLGEDDHDVVCTTMTIIP